MYHFCFLQVPLNMMRETIKAWLYPKVFNFSTKLLIYIDVNFPMTYESDTVSKYTLKTMKHNV